MHKHVNKLKKVIAASVAGVFVMMPAHVYAWGFKGHEYIGESAYEYLTDDAKVWVDAHLNRVGEPSLASAATWADRARGTELGSQLAPMHYANISPNATELDMQRDCPARRCVIGAAFDALDVLFDPTASADDQADHLRRLSHWIGDLHQPLHLGLEADRGGNTINVIYNGQEENLHRVWDTSLINEQDLTPPATLARTKSLNEVTEDWYEAIKDWATESHQLAADYAYSDLTDGDTLSTEYLQDAHRITEQQLTAASQRLAQLLNTAATINNSSH